MSVRGLFKSEIEKAQTRLNSLFGEETFLTFREDLRAIYIEHRDVEDATEWQKRAWMHMGRQGLDETRRRYISFGTHLDLLNLSDAALSAAIGFGINWGQGTGGPVSTIGYYRVFRLSVSVFDEHRACVRESTRYGDCLPTRTDTRPTGTRRPSFSGRMEQRSYTVKWFGGGNHNLWNHHPSRLARL